MTSAQRLLLRLRAIALVFRRRHFTAGRSPQHATIDTTRSHFLELALGIEEC
jgi:hypothetical protein